jgi:hypothetical protein
LDAVNEEIVREHDRIKPAAHPSNAGRVRLTEATVRRSSQQGVGPASDPKVAAVAGAEGGIVEAGVAVAEILQTLVD